MAGPSAGAALPVYYAPDILQYSMFGWRGDWLIGQGDGSPLLTATGDDNVDVSQYTYDASPPYPLNWLGIENVVGANPSASALIDQTGAANSASQESREKQPTLDVVNRRLNFSSGHEQFMSSPNLSFGATAGGFCVFNPASISGSNHAIFSFDSDHGFFAYIEDGGLLYVGQTYGSFRNTCRVVLPSANRWYVLSFAFDRNAINPTDQTRIWLDGSDADVALPESDDMGLSSFANLASFNLGYDRLSGSYADGAINEISLGTDLDMLLNDTNRKGIENYLMSLYPNS